MNKVLDGCTLTDALERFKQSIGETIQERLKKREEERVPKLVLSNLGKPLRQLWYDLKGYKPEPLSSETKLKFVYGAILEDLFLYLAEEAGHKVEQRQKRLEYDGIPGKIDAKIDDVLVDIKSCSTFSFEKFRKGTLVKDDPFGYIAQLTSYKEADGAKRAAFIAIDKTLGNICSFELTEEIVNEYKLSDRVRQVRDSLSKVDPPERCYGDKPASKEDKSGNRILSTGCSYCGHKQRCWSDSNEGRGLQVRYYSSGPKWFTNLVKEPKLRNNYNNYNEDFEVK